jgi:hypothetical protein
VTTAGGLVTTAGALITIVAAAVGGAAGVVAAVVAGVVAGAAGVAAVLTSLPMRATTVSSSSAGRSSSFGQAGALTGRGAPATAVPNPGLLCIGARGGWGFTGGAAVAGFAAC